VRSGALLLHGNPTSGETRSWLLARIVVAF
jgi:hypothetical protein